MALMMRRAPHLFKRFLYLSCSIPLPGQSVREMIGNSIQGDNPDEVGWPLDPQSTPMEQRYNAMFCNDMDAQTKAEFLTKLGKDQWPLEPYTFTDWNHDRLDAVPSLSFSVCGTIYCLKRGSMCSPNALRRSELSSSMPGTK